jgi:hypothetical protein
MNNEEIKTPNLNYAAALLKRLISPLASADPSAEDFKRLSGPLHEIALAVLSEGRDKTARRKRLEAEAAARGLDLLISETDSADPQADLSTFQTSNGWEPFDLADVQDEIIPPTQYLVKPYVSRPGVTIFFGRPKELKSLVVLEMGLHVAGGIPWLASSSTSNDGIEVKQGRVVWLDLENGTLTMKRRMKAFQSALGMRAVPGQFIVYSFPSPALDLSKDDNVIELIARLQALGGIDLFIVDHLGQLFLDIDENSPLSSKIMGAIKRISEICQISICLIHHANKFVKQGGTLADSLRGSGAILANIDSLIFVKRDEIDRNQIQIIPAAVRGPEAKNISATFAFEQDEYLDLTQARFWRMAWRDAYSLARDLILNALQGDKELNHTQLRNVCKTARISSVTDQVARNIIDTLESSGEILMRPGPKQSKLYRMAENEDD